MKYLIIDASLNGTGIRDKYNGGYLDPEDLGLSFTTKFRLKEWMLKYADEHYNGFANDSAIDELDSEGKDIALEIKKELFEAKIEYFSDARMTNEAI